MKEIKAGIATLENLKINANSVEEAGRIDGFIDALETKAVSVRAEMIEAVNEDTEIISAMSLFDATMIAEGVEEADRETQLEAWAMLIRTGTVWQLQGWFGRTAKDLINSGQININGEVL